MKNLIIILSFIPAISFAQDAKTLIVHGDTLWFKNITQNDSLQLTKTGGSSQTWTNKTMSTGSVWNGTAIGDAYISSASTWNAKVNISDTSTMLSKYLRKQDSAAMLLPYLRSNVAAATYQAAGSYATTSQNALKVNISDTAAAFSPYLRSNVASATYQPIGTYATGSGTASGTNTGDNAVNSLYSGLVSNATHTGDATGATVLTVVALNGTNLSSLGTGILKNTTGTGVPSIAAQADITGLLGASSITNTMLAGSIAYSKLSLTGAVLNADLAGSIAYSKLSLTGAILNADLAGSIAYSKLSLTGAILNADLAGSIAYSKLSLTGAILNADLAGSIASSKLVGSDITTVGTIATGTWNATAIADGKIASALTGKTYNALTLTANATGFSVAGGTSSKTITMSNSLTFAGTDASTLNIGTGGTLGTAAFTAASAYQPIATNLTSIGALANTSGYLNNNGSGVFSYVTPSGTGDMILGNIQTVTGAKTFSAGALISAANSTSNAAQVFTPSGASLKTTSAGGDHEVDANGLMYYTNEATAGRGYQPSVQRFRLTADGSTISTISNFFGATSNPTLVSGGEYIIEVDCYYTNTTGGTVTWTFTNSAAPTSQNIHARFSPVAGIVAPAGSAAATYLEGDIQGDATAAKALTTSGTLTTATTQWAHFSIHLYNSTGTSLKIQATKLVGGTITPLKGSYWTCTRVPAANTGIFVN